MVEVEALNLHKRLAHLSDGRTVPITTFLDNLGDETSNLVEATLYVAGAGREWWSGPLADFKNGGLI